MNAGDEPYVFSIEKKLDRAMNNGRYSAHLVNDLDQHLRNGTVNIYYIFDAIAEHEGLSTGRRAKTKRAAPLTGPWLQGLWHKHYTQASFIRHNVRNHWAKKGKLEKLRSQIIGTKTSFSMEEALDLSRKFAQAVVEGGYWGRGANEQLTGEWIMFAVEDGCAYYLTLATHAEDDEDIWNRCIACAAEFPELAILREQRKVI